MFIFSILDIFIGLFICYSAISILLLNNSNIEALTILRWTMVIVIYITLRNINRSCIILHAIASSSFLQAAIIIAQKIGYAESTHIMFDVTGTFGNPGQVAGYISIGLVISVSIWFNLFKQNKSVVVYLYTIFIIISVIALWLTNSRTSLIALIIGLAILFHQEIWSFTKKHIRIVTLISILSTPSLFLLLFNYRPASANARLLIWRVGTDMIVDKPVFGHGIGTFNWKYMLYQAEYFKNHPQSQFSTVADNAAYSYNELLHITIELGIIGLIIALAIIFILLFSHNSNQQEKTVKGALGALITFSMFSYPSSILPVLILLPILAGITNSKPLFLLKPYRSIIVVIQILLFVFIINVSKSMLCYNTASKESLNLFTNRSLFSEKSFELLFGNIEFGDLYAAYIGENHNMFDDNIMQYLPPSCETFCTIGCIYTEQRKYEKAEYYYYIAKNMIPTRLKPSYGLWKMYLTKGDMVNAMRMAKEILNQPLKLENTFTLRSKAEVRLWLKTVGL